MALQGCADHSNSDNSNFSSPLPIIGLYVVGANLVCLVLIALDMDAGFRDRKRWLPCRLFSLNSLTLTLIAIATKLPIDITTAMPSAQDQLSKLTGTIFTCICIGFLMPSLGSATYSECMWNMASLTILVITVLVNIGIQMHTGLINSFHTEHKIVLCCIMLMLTMLWNDALNNLDDNKRFYTNRIKKYFSNGKGSLLRRLKVCFIYCFESNPQLRRSRDDLCTATCALCMVCIVVLLKVIFQSFHSKYLKFCHDISDYGWSMWAIVLSQIIAIFVGGSGIIIRFLSMANLLRLEFPIPGDIFGFVGGIVFLVMKVFEFILKFILSLGVLVVVACLVDEPRRYNYGEHFETRKLEDENEDEELRKEYKEYEGLLDDWTLRKSAKEIKKLIAESTAKVPNHLIDLLRRTPPSQQSLTTFLKNQHERCSLFLVVLTKLATLSMQSSQRQCIFRSLDEVFEVIYYIDQKTSSASIKKKSNLANNLRKYEGFSHLFSNPKFKVVRSQLKLVDNVIETIKKFKEGLRGVDECLIAEEVGIILDIIRQKAYNASIEELHIGLEQMFVDMLHERLIQLPGIILKEINESSPEDLEKRLTEALKVVSKIQQLEGLIQWSFPVGTTITSLATEASIITGVSTIMDNHNNGIATTANTDEIPIADNQIDRPFEGASSILGSIAEGNVSINVSLAIEDEIIQIE